MHAFAFEQRQLCRGLSVSAMNATRAWLPLGFEVESAQLIWRWLGEKRCTEPFFADAWRAQETAQRSICRTNLTATQAICQDLPQVPIKALIFHSSRCGSTLLMQMLACLPECIALSEPPVLEACLQYLHRNADPITCAKQWLPLILAGLSQQRFANEQFCVIKLDSWHICDLPLLRAALPETPFYFLYRQPQAILTSHQRQPGPQMVPGLLDHARLGISSHSVPFNEWGDALLQCYFQCALDYAQQSSLNLLHYQQLPSMLWQHLLAEWGIYLSQSEIALLQERSKCHGKYLGNFQGDPPTLAPPPVSSALQTLYEKLEELRFRY